MRNTHKTIAQSVATLQEILVIAQKTGKQVVAYLSMGFGNPYGDPWNVDVVSKWVEKISEYGGEDSIVIRYHRKLHSGGHRLSIFESYSAMLRN